MNRGRTKEESREMFEERKRETFVGRIPTRLTKDDLETYFSKFGQVEHITHINKGKAACAFVRFATHEMLDECMMARPLELGGRPVEATYASLGDDPAKTIETTKIFVMGRKSPKFDEDCMRAQFERFGDIEHVHIGERKKKPSNEMYATITFSNPTSADRAVLEGNKIRFTAGDGSGLTIRKFLDDEQRARVEKVNWEREMRGQRSGKNFGNSQGGMGGQDGYGGGQGYGNMGGGGGVYGSGANAMMMGGGGGGFPSRYRGKMQGYLDMGREVGGGYYGSGGGGGAGYGGAFGGAMGAGNGGIGSMMTGGGGSSYGSFTSYGGGTGGDSGGGGGIGRLASGFGPQAMGMAATGAAVGTGQGAMTGYGASYGNQGIGGYGLGAGAYNQTESGSGTFPSKSQNSAVPGAQAYGSYNQDFTNDTPPANAPQKAVGWGGGGVEQGSSPFGGAGPIRAEMGSASSGSKFELLLEKAGVSEAALEKLRSENILDASILSRLSARDVEDLSFSIGDRNRIMMVLEMM